MMQTNPYQPPGRPAEYRPLLIRLKRALKLAKTEYSRGLRRDGITLREHIRAWLALFVLCVVFGAIATSLAVSVYFELRNQLP